MIANPTYNIKSNQDAQHVDDALGIIMAARDCVDQLKAMEFTTAKGSDKLLKITRLLENLETDAYWSVKSAEQYGEKEQAPRL